MYSVNLFYRYLNFYKDYYQKTIDHYIKIIDINNRKKISYLFEPPIMYWKENNIICSYLYDILGNEYNITPLIKSFGDNITKMNMNDLQPFFQTVFIKEIKIIDHDANIHNFDINNSEFIF
jgi:hypothetical protein